MVLYLDADDFDESWFDDENEDWYYNEDYYYWH